MPIQHIHTYLVRPNKGVDDPPQINGTTVPRNGPLFDLLNNIYTRSDEECLADITFRPTPEGVQQNDCRDLICSYLGGPTLARGRLIAHRLEQHTDNRSGLGLLFLMAGMEGNEHKIVISRFPTDHAIYVEEDPQDFTVEFLERVFMKNRSSYKAVAYQHASLQAGIWFGRSVDRQMRGTGIEASDYWIQDFLGSELTVTPAAGTRRFATALSNALKNPDLDVGVTQEITAAANLAAGLAGQNLSITEIGNRFGLSEEANIAITKELKSANLAEQRFRFDLPNFQTVLAFKTVELNNGGLLTASSGEFDDVFRKEIIDAETHEARFITEGRVVNERLKQRV